MSAADWHAAMARISPAHFAHLATRGRYQLARHILHLNRVLLDLVDGKLAGALIAMPPRHGKSRLCAQFFPAWFLGRFPDKRVMLIGHQAQLSKKSSREARDAIELYGPALFGVRVRRDHRAVGSWGIEDHEGGMLATGRSGSATGHGADLLCVDDLFKDSAEAMSKTIRENAWELWMSTIETRLEPGGVAMVIATRWHEDDVSGRLLREIERGDRPGWQVVSLPAIAEEQDPLGRAAGEALWPQRYPIEVLERKRRQLDHDEARMGPYWFEALYQQHPTPREGAIFKRSWFRYFSEDADHYILQKPTGTKAWKKSDCWRFTTVDLAVSEKTTADYFCLGVWTITPEKDLLLSLVVRERLEGPDQAPLIVRLNTEHPSAFIGIEEVAYQLSLIQDLDRKGLPVKGIRVDRDKVARAQLPATRFSAGSVYFRSGAAYLTSIEEELLVFPNGQHDDQVDMISMAAAELATFSIPRIY